MDVSSLPRLAIGLSAEFDSARRGIDTLALRAEAAGLFDFLEYGCDRAAMGLPGFKHWVKLTFTGGRT